MSLTAVSVLASYHYKERCLGKEGLGLHVAGYEDANGKHKEGILASFLRSLLQLLLFEDYKLVHTTRPAICQFGCALTNNILLLPVLNLLDQQQMLSFH